MFITRTRIFGKAVRASMEINSSGGRKYVASKYHFKWLAVTQKC